MAWKSSGVWKKPIDLPQTNRDDSSFPGLKPKGPEAATKIEYEELQQNELIALEAIYGEDFKSDPSFDVRIRASSDDDFAVTLGVVMTATYPKSPPLLTLKKTGDLREVTLFKLQKFIETQPKIFATEEQEMVDRIVEGIRDILEDAAQAKAKGLELPSLEEERAAHEASLAKLAQEQKAEEERKREEENKEEERVLGGLLQVELKRQKDKAKETRKKNRPNGLPSLAPMDGSNGPESGRIIFDRPCHTTDKTGNIISFQAVFGKSEVAKGPVSTVFSVWPVVGSGQDCPNLALKEAILRTTAKEDASVFKKQVQSLESQLEALKQVRHRNLLEVLDFRVEREKSNAAKVLATLWTVNVLTPSAEKGSLAELLDLAGQLDTSKVRAWTRDLLDALNFLHNKSMVHQDIHAGNVLLFREQTGEVVPKLADAGYQRELHNISSKGHVPLGLSSAKSAYWLPPETAALSKPHYTQKTDMWEFGIVFLQMIFGLDVPQKYHSPSSVSDSMSLSRPLQELVTRFFKADPKKRPRAFELGSSEFLATDAPVIVEDSPAITSNYHSLNALSPIPPRLRRESTNRTLASSRYREDFDEEGRLGKGGFGEVVKARKKLDGQIYAIKKISQRSQASLTEILKEVRLLSQLSHPAVVRYYNTWVEEVPDQSDTEGDTSTEDLNTEDSRDTVSQGAAIHFATSTGGLDFMSSSGYPQVEFGYDDSDAEEDSDEEEEDDDEEDSEDESDSDSDDSSQAVGRAPRSKEILRRNHSHRSSRTVLYISMEYCEKRILEGLAHIHGLSIVHRDLKPENIFIAHSSDGTDNVKIGDFGLATSGQFAVDKALPNTMESDDITRSIGTTSYAAPEMYSLGIIFFEMCYPPMLGMQRAEVLEKLRRPSPILPSDFKPADRIQTEIVLSLVTHNPKERPSSAELLQSGKLPVQMESETIRRTLAGLADPSSPYYKKMLSTLFSRPLEQAKDYAWDMHETSPSQADLLNQSIVKETLISIFRRHGALECQRTCLYPRSAHYAENVVRLLDSNGTVLQLPFDLTMGHARMLAKASGTPGVQRTFTFGNIFRDKGDTGQPYMLGEVDFDIVTTNTLDLALKEAEVLKVLDEIIATFPSLSSSQMCFHLGHSDLLQLIFDYCRVEHGSRRAVADVLSKLNIHHWTWQKIRAQLRSPLVGLSATSVDELQRFDFRDTPSKAFSKLKTLFEGTDLYQRASSTLAHLKEVSEYAKRLGVASKIYVTPLNSLKESFYTGGILFSCLYDKKVKDVFAAGGRYDSLIRENRPKIGSHYEERHAVGFNLSWEKLSRTPKSSGKAFLKKSEEESHNIFQNVKRCDALVASFDAAVLRSTGIEILQTLWSHNISAELAKDARSPEDLLSRNRDEGYSWIIIIKQDAILKVKTMDKKDIPDVDIPMAQLLSWLRAEIRERDSKSLVKLRNNAQQSETGAAVEAHQEQDVRVLTAQTRSKKFNRRTVVEQAQVSAASLVHSFLDGPILAVETTDQVMDLIRDTCLSDGESWRKVEHSVTTAEKKYVREIHDMLLNWKWAWERKNASRHSFLYNFRTGNCIYYDLGA
ncbi:eIF-2-alpha kinase GCN2 [Colletotrichum spaethianum]|uniref:non-specific serine/threonine protein kinase n=1 Tax=Colletotrichum spaethianum TaxID=700344 RepID=A0AA37UK02_9PEZI|nr:eIF-2-alpha kinase GCN2 [Colletotrichum spaethianum]GKT49171.1 eIF-2-alpha kinase GCN2 [Colletotrichum spaethianum]